MPSRRDLCGFGPIGLVAFGVMASSGGCVPRVRAPEANESSALSPWFADITTPAGLQFVHDVEDQGDYFMPEIMGSGAALFDFDGDGRLDVLLVNGQWSHGAGNSRMRNQLYRQNAVGEFGNVTAVAGLADAPGYGVGVAIGDIDNDGLADVYVTAFGGDRLWLNNGDGTLSDQTGQIENANQRWGTAAAFFDYDGDGWLDLFVVNYLDYFPETQCDEGTSRLDFCGPKSFAGAVARLYRNLGGRDESGRLFAETTVEAGLAEPSPGLGLILRDFDGDGRPDIYVADDMSPDRLWVQQSDGTFLDEGVQRGIAYNRLGQAEASMGVACGDLNGDGQFDLFTTNLRGETNTLFLGQPGGQFVDGTAGSGLGPPSLPFTGFGVVAFDLECDGDLDLVVVNGRVKRGATLPTAALGQFWNDYAQPNQIYLNGGDGRFTELKGPAGTLTSRLNVARALVYGDIDNDGDLDLVVTACTGPARLHRNDVPRAGGWLMVRAIDRAGNRDAIGAQIVVEAGGRTFRREVAPSSSYLSSHDVRLHFGLGPAERVDKITVVWTDGQREDFEGGPADRHVTLVRGHGLPAKSGASP